MIQDDDNPGLQYYVRGVSQVRRVILYYARRRGIDLLCSGDRGSGWVLPECVDRRALSASEATRMRTTGAGVAATPVLIMPSSRQFSLTLMLNVGPVNEVEISGKRNQYRV